MKKKMFEANLFRYFSERIRHNEETNCTCTHYFYGDRITGDLHKSSQALELTFLLDAYYVNSKKYVPKKPSAPRFTLDMFETKN